MPSRTSWATSLRASCIRGSRAGGQPLTRGGRAMGEIEPGGPRIVVLKCDECGEPQVGCPAVDCALTSRPYAGEDVVPAEQFRGAVDLLRWALPYLPEPLPSMEGGEYAKRYAEP